MDSLSDLFKRSFKIKDFSPSEIEMILNRDVYDDSNNKVSHRAIPGNLADFTNTSRSRHSFIIL